MTGLDGVLAVHSRVSQIEARLGIGATGRDVRAQASFDDVLARVGGTERAGAAPSVASSTAATGALERLASQLGIDTTAPVDVPAPASTGSLAGVPFGDLFVQAGRRHGVDPELLAAVADAESGYDPTAVSHAGAQGLMQLMPGTAAGLGVTDPFDPTQAVDGASRLLAGHLDQFGSTELALAAYNAGPGAVTRFGGVPPYAETQAYVPKVLQRYQELLR